MAQYTTFNTTASEDVIITSNGAGKYYTLTRYPGSPIIPLYSITSGDALIQGVWFNVSDTYQYSSMRLAKVRSHAFDIDMGVPFTTSGASASHNVLEELEKPLYNEIDYYEGLQTVPIQVLGAGKGTASTEGNVFRILNGATISIIVKWDYRIRPWHKVGGMWHQIMLRDNSAGYWHQTFVRRNVGNAGGFWD